MDLLFFDPNSLTRLAAQAAAATGGHRVALLAIAGAEVVIYAIGYTVIGWQLWQMHKDGKQRDQEIDAMGQGLRQQAKQAQESTERLRQALDRQHEAMTQMLDRQRQALDRQRQAFDRQRAVLGPLLRPTP